MTLLGRHVVAELSDPRRSVRHGPPAADRRRNEGVAVTDSNAIAIDCATCPVRAVACHDCVVSVLLGPPEFDRAAADALVVLADRGLVPPLQDPREVRPTRAG